MRSKCDVLGEQQLWQEKLLSSFMMFSHQVTKHQFIYRRRDQNYLERPKAVVTKKAPQRIAQITYMQVKLKLK